MVNRPDHLRFARIWILFCAFLVCSGWLLSAIGQLSAPGYLAALAVGGALSLKYGLVADARNRFWPAFGKLKWRFAHFLPALFLLYAALSALGGLLYEPTNYDGLTYRFPRILCWLTEHRWHWIATTEVRMNISATGFEWLMLPVFAFTKSARFFFLPNLLSYLLLPGLTYAAFQRLGVGKRMAWHWMWLLPCGYGFVLQAGSIGNDAFAAVYLLASVCFALKFRETGKASDFWVGMIAAALLTGAKASNLPLVLPWALLSLGATRLLRTRPLACGGVLLVCVLVSFVPIAFQNARHTGDWAGEPSNRGRMKIENPVHGILGNGLQLICQNGVPPVMPWAKAWNRAAQSLMETPAFQPLVRSFPRMTLKCGELPLEETAGLGLGLAGLLAVTFVAGWRRPQGGGGPLGRRATGLVVCLGAWVALAVYMAKMGSESGARLILPYYPLVIVSVLLLPGASRLAQKRWWRNTACLAAFMALPALILTPARPLWPALSVCDTLTARMPENPFVKRLCTVYSVYRNRSDNLAPLRKYLSEDDKVVGFVGADDSQASLWRPFGKRQVVNLLPGPLPTFLKRPWRAVVREDAIRIAFGQTMEQWLAETGGRVVARETLVTKATSGPEDWCVIQFENALPPSSK